MIELTVRECIERLSAKSLYLSSETIRSNCKNKKLKSRIDTSGKYKQWKIELDSLIEWTKKRYGVDI